MMASPISRRSTLALGLGLLAPGVMAASPLPVVASFSILADLTREVGGERIAVTTLAPIGVDLHDFQPRPSDARGIAGAAVFVINGLGLEGWATRLAQSAGFKGRGVVATKGMRALAMAHNHGSSGAKGHDHAHGSWDPHGWQDVANARLYVANIRDGLTLADPDGAETYAARATAYLARLDALDAEIRAALAAIPQPQRRFVTTHEAFNYYADAYDVEILAAQGISSDTEPSPRAFATLIAQVRRENIKALFLESNIAPRLLEQLSRETQVRIGGTLYADSLSAPDGPAPSYVEMMRANTRAIVSALR